MSSVVRRKNIGTSTFKFLLGGVRCQGVTAPPSPPGTLRWMGYPYPPHTQDKYCRSIKKQQSTGRTNAHNSCVRVFIMTSWAPRGALHYRHQNGKGLLSQPRQGFKHRSSIFRSRTFAPAPSAVYSTAEWNNIVIMHVLTKCQQPVEGAPGIAEFVSLLKRGRCDHS